MRGKGLLLQAEASEPGILVGRLLEHEAPRKQVRERKPVSHDSPVECSQTRANDGVGNRTQAGAATAPDRVGMIMATEVPLKPAR